MNGHSSNLEVFCLFVFCICFTEHHISRVSSCLPHIGGKYSSSRPGTLCALWLWKCHQPLPKSSDRRGGSFRGWNQKVSCWVFSLLMYHLPFFLPIFQKLIGLFSYITATYLLQVHYAVIPCSRDGQPLWRKCHHNKSRHLGEAFVSL